MWRQASLPAVEGGILPPGKYARIVKCSMITVVFSLKMRCLRAGRRRAVAALWRAAKAESHGSTSAKMADATIFRHALSWKLFFAFVAGGIFLVLADDRRDGLQFIAGLQVDEFHSLRVASGFADAVH